MSWFVAHYEPGPNWHVGKAICDQPLDGHVDYLRNLHRDGSVVMAGPFLDSSGGLVVFAIDDPALVEAVISNDPAIIEGTLVAKFNSWMRVV